MQFPNHVISPDELREYAAAMVAGRVLAALAEQLEQATDDPEPATVSQCPWM